MGFHLQHPSAPFNGIPAENCFFCVNDAGEAVSQGYLLALSKPELYPDRPLNIYMHIAGSGRGDPRQIVGRDLLLGALLARAKQIREASPGMRARLFTCVDMRDAQSLQFYREAGFDTETARQALYEIHMPEVISTAPMGFKMGITRLMSANDYDRLLMRIQRTQRILMRQDELQAYVRQGLFLPMYIAATTGEAVGECIFTGDGRGSALLLCLYVNQNLRGHGLEEALLRYGMNTLAQSYGAQRFYAYVQTNIPCETEITNTSAVFCQDQLCYPERLYD